MSYFEYWPVRRMMQCGLAQKGAGLSLWLDPKSIDITGSSYFYSSCQSNCCMGFVLLATKDNEYIAGMVYLEWARP